MKNLIDSPQFPDIVKFENIVDYFHMTLQSNYHLPLSY